MTCRIAESLYVVLFIMEREEIEEKEKMLI
jgi:hypothetical protein